MSKKIENILTMVMFSCLAIAALGYVGWIIYSGLYLPLPPDRTVKFEVVGITNSTDASSLVILHYTCMKWCDDEHSEGSYLEKCWRECEKLGREGCTNITS